MVHLAMHLATEAKLAGPVQFRWMYPIERFLRKLKCYVRNKNHPEGCMAEGYIVEESIIFCSRYLHGVHNPFDKLERNGDRDSIGSGKKVSVFNQNGYPLTMDKNRSLEDLERTQAHIYILNNCEEVQPFIREYETSSKNEDFAEWFKNHASQLCTNKDVQSRAELLSLARGPLYGVDRFNGYVINGFRFHTQKHETRKAKQNSGILLKGLMGSKVVDYYGVLTEIIELQYLGGNRVVMFKCEWWDVENIDRGVKVDKYGFVSVNTSRKLVTNEPFVLASQVEQVFYAQDGSNPNWIVVLKGQSQSSFDHFSEDSVDEQSYEQEEAFQQEKSATNYPIHNLVQGNELDDWEENDEAHDDSDDNSSHSENSADEGQSSGESEDNDDFLL
ncbi:unnamed protein product [Linum tenue]|uniref:DUF4218 domain-containing protein n=1 Tax=Linum tenue TaxID=586396 RepID=A0AAV0KTB0_9ROSI|nr:unnamed protein product [Linum tenue]